MDIVIVCHVEFGFVRERRIIFDKSGVQGVSGGVRNLADLARKYGAKITFAVCPEVAQDVPQDLGHEIGLHVHAGWEVFRYKRYTWHIGDSYLRKASTQSGQSTNMSDYSYEEQLGMIQKGKERIQEVLRTDPKVFVAGRWALNTDTVKALEYTGFSHDCSAVPGIKQNYDWSKLPRIASPYHPSKEDYQKQGNSSLVIVPVSQAWGDISANPESARVCGLPWLKACFEEYLSQRAPVFHIALHSPAMTDPFYLHVMDAFLSFIARHQGIRFIFASQVKAFPGLSIQPNIWNYLKGVNPTLLKSAFLR